MEKHYEPRKVEKDIFSMWQKGKHFSAEKDESKKPFVVVIPPPNVTGSLHMGHALNNTINDVIVRWHRMKGEPTEWAVGTDHAGIATQNVYEKKLRKEGKSRFSLGRSNFVREVWEWKNEYEARILGQLKTLGCSCDWERARFTMDKEYSRAVIKTFVHYWKKNYLYRGNRITNWCPRCGTSLSDLEVEHKEVDGFLWHIKYEVVGGGSIVVATTRPETMLGDTAIAVNPKDKRYMGMIGKRVILPLQNREIPIVGDEVVDIAFGTGAVKVTPAHDATDYEIGERHKLEKPIVIDLRGKMTELAGKDYFGLKRFEAREKVIAELKKGGLLVKTQEYSHNIGHCYRCDTIIEPLLTLQWFLRMDELAKPAIKVVEDGKIKFHPAKWEKVYLDWMRNLKDWNISRQIWWGHQIPAWYCECGETVVSEEWALQDDIDGNVSSSTEKKTDRTGKIPKHVCPKCKGDKLKRDEDVLDTWFSSALWPFAVFGWPEKTKELEYFYPTAFLSTARDIIYLWVARMIMSGIEFMGEIPFKDVYIHATVFNKEGKRMSKSLGTGVDPLELIDKYGADATRFGLLWQVAQGQDMKFGEDAIVNGKRFANKLWNASRFTLMNLEDYKCATLPALSEDNVSPIRQAQGVSRETLSNRTGETFEAEIKQNMTKGDREVIKKLSITIKKTDKYLQALDFQHAIEGLYEFFWHDFCDIYIEDAKVRIREVDASKTAAQYTLDTVLKDSLKLLHPFMPFVTEEIWKNMAEDTPLIVSSWPQAD